ncbi:MAG: hypothetical protein JO250_02090 [Armatimonadetes bacterium]|nr:hypothetical protein [Armatimonadota bacterium]
MTFALPRRRGKAQRALALLSSAALAPSALLTSAIAQTPAPAPVQNTTVPQNAAPAPAPPATNPPPASDAAPAPPAAPVSPAPPAAPAAPASPIVPASPASPRPLSGAHNLLARLAPQPMGANNAVRLWVRGDGSGASLRVHLIAAGQDASAADAALTAPAWLSAPIPVTWSGWRELVLPREKFTLRDAGVSTALNAALPADAQPDGVASATPDWAAINAIALETGVPKRAALGVDDIAWVTLDSSGAGTSSTIVDDFETGDVAAWQSAGTTDQKRTLTYGLATAPAQVHGGRVAFQINVTAPVTSRQVALASVKRQLAATGQPYLVWVPANRFEPILPASLPPPAGANSDLLLQAAPDQTLAASFCVYSARPLSQVAVTVPAELQGIGHVLRATSGPPVLDVCVVKAMKEPGGGLIRDDDFAGLTPDLLVKDDRVPLSGPAPDVRLTGSPVTDIPADTAKQFWVTLSVPKNALPGLYTARMLVRGAGMTPVPVRLSLTVLPLRLASGPSKQYAINLRSRLDPAPAVLPSPDGHLFVTDFVSKDILDRQLADIAAHGFHIATLYDSPQTLWDALAEYQANGMTAPFVYKGDGDPHDVEATRRARSAPPFVYFVDPAASDSVARAQSLGKHGLPVTTYITREADYTALESSLSLPVYSRDSDYSQQQLQTHGRRQDDKQGNSTDWWYWPAADEEPTADRLACGWSLVRANLYGAFIPDYQTAFGADPYDLTSGGAAPVRAALRSQMLTYPARDGVIDTLRWEAAREGVTDVRYLTTLYDNVRQCKDAKIAKPFTDKAEAYVKSFLDKSPLALTDSDLDTARAQVARYALLLRAQLDAYNKKHPVAP